MTFRGVSTQIQNQRLILLCALLVAACGDAPVNPRTAARMEYVAGNLQEGFPGVVLDQRVAVRVLDAHNRPVSGVSVSWTAIEGGGTVVPLRTTTDADGVARASWMPGLTPGENELRAMVHGALPLRFSAITDDLPDTCGEFPLDLPLGGAFVFRPSQVEDLCIRSGSIFTRDFVLAAFNTTRAEISNAIIGVRGTSVLSASSPPTPSISPPVRPEFQPHRPGDKRDDAFHLRLRESERRELAPRVLSRLNGNTSQRFTASYDLSTPTVGESVSLNTNAGSACDVAQMRASQVKAITQHAIVVADNMNPTGGFTDAEYASIAATYDTLVHPIVTDNFGQTADLDGNNRVILFFTQEVNRLTPPAAAAGFIAGFFFARDLFPKTSNGNLSGCATSNEAEIVYLMVPDPDGTINQNERDKEFVAQRVVSTLAHEVQHLINSSQRLHINQAEYPEKSWLDEALAHVAEELLFFRASGLQPRQNITSVDIAASATRREAFDRFQSENVARLRVFLNETNDNWIFRGGSPDVITRGAATWFLRYVADRLDKPERDVWRKLAAGPDTGLRNVQAVIEADAMQWLRDWAVSLYVDDAVFDLAPVYQVSSWHLRSIMLGVSDGEPYPIRTISLFPIERKEVTLKSGGSSYFRFGVAPALPARLTIDAAGADAENISLVLIRTR